MELGDWCQSILGSGLRQMEEEEKDSPGRTVARGLESEGLYSFHSVPPHPQTGKGHGFGFPEKVTSRGLVSKTDTLNPFSRGEA